MPSSVSDSSGIQLVADTEIDLVSERVMGNPSSLQWRSSVVYYMGVHTLNKLKRHIKHHLLNEKY